MNRHGHKLGFRCHFLIFVLAVAACVFQATAEQIRLAQMIYDKNDADFEDKVNQVRPRFIFKPSFITSIAESCVQLFYITLH